MPVAMARHILVKTEAEAAAQGGAGDGRDCGPGALHPSYRRRLGRVLVRGCSVVWVLGGGGVDVVCVRSYRLFVPARSLQSVIHPFTSNMRIGVLQCDPCSQSFIHSHLTYALMCSNLCFSYPAST